MQPDRGLFLIADGMGGHAAGDVASDMAARHIARVLGAPCPQGDILVSGCLRRAIREANEAIYERALSEPQMQGMGTTLTALVLRDGAFLVGQVGDSRAYLLRGGELLRLTKDHSYVQELIDAGSLEPARARAHPYANFITRSVGARAEVTPDIYAGEVMPRDLFLLTSDGLTGVVDDRRLGEILSLDRSPEELVQLLIESANRAGGPDNVTAVVVRVDAVEVRQAA